VPSAGGSSGAARFFWVLKPTAPFAGLREYSYFSKTMNRLLCGLLLLMGTLSCEYKRMDTRGMAQEMRDRKVKHVTPSQLTTLADLWGGRIVGQLNADVIESLRSPRLIDSLQTAYGARIQFESLGTLGRTGLDPKVQELYEAYRYTARQRQVPDPNVQKLQDGAQLLYSAPVVLTPKLGARWRTLPATEQQPLTRNFGFNPTDTAGTGRFLGLWSVTFQRKELILRVDAKDLKKLDSRP
jgi:hypothetical protein